MRRNTTMEDVLIESKKLVQDWQSPLGESPPLICSNNTRYGELLFPKKLSSWLLRGECKDAAVTELNKQLTDSHNVFFTELVLIRQEHLFLRLNRPFIFSKFIHKITTCREKFGTTTHPERHQCIAIVPHVLCGEDLRLSDLSLSEGRSLLVAALLQKTLLLMEHVVRIHSTGSICTGTPDSVSSTFNFLFDEIPKKEPNHHVTVNTFVASFLPPNSTSSELSGTGSSEPTASSNDGRGPQTRHCGVLADAQGFAAQHKLTGKGGYEKNIDKIEVTDASGQLTPVARWAFTVCAHCSTDHVIIHIAQQQMSFRAQQVMLLVDIFNSRNGSPASQHIAQTSAVDGLCAGSTRSHSIMDLLRIRRKQIASAMSLKYGDQIEGAQLQLLAGQMADAVIKFELLSHDPTSAIKLDVSVSHGELDVRFDGAFVMYNYARVSTLLHRHSLSCEQGTYPSLPSVETVDFSLLKEEEEWELMFLYVLQYPLIVREAASVVKRGVGLHVNLGLKKICQFLTKFCHAFSSYYSRVKVLMPPEPHLLPLIHARLYLMKSIKQVLHNALTLLAIEPLDQL